jgi:osmotically-inducible protein OsmY
MKQGTLKRFSVTVGLGFSLTLMANSAWCQASNAMRPKAVPPESLSTPSRGIGVNDGIISARAKTALLRADHVDSNNVHVTTAGGVVKLEGHVAAAAQKQAAGDAVQSLDGVTAVQNDLTVEGAAGH